MDIQFYPTTPSLARKAWNKFKRKNVVRLLEPSAGEGDLLLPYLEDSGYSRWRRELNVDVIEIDISRHPILKEKMVNVVGVDFLQFNGASIYSHILLNPPFQEGVKHVLKAWEILFDGEVVAIINAETIKNPYSAERKMLVSLIEQHGSVEFLQEEFATEESARKTNVEVALIHLEKDCNFEMNFLAGLEVDSMTSAGLSSGFKEMNDIAIHQGMIDNAVTAFNAAVKAVREEVFASARSRYYTALLGDTMETLNSPEEVKDKDYKAKVQLKANLDSVREALQTKYDDLKNRAWTQILKSTQVKSRLSSKAQKRLESEFENMKKLEFTTANIYGFILGLINKSADINIEMVCDVFDLITKYHSDNRVYIKGWKSNDAHIGQAYKVKMKRFVIPGNGVGYGRGPNHETINMLSDYDKVFCMLDGKRECDVSLAYAFDTYYSELKHGQRIKTSYFDIRYYPGAGTIHFFPTNQKLIDRFNRMVGRHRQWLPQENETVPEAFWLMYDKAEEFSGDVEKAIAVNTGGYHWRDLRYDLDSNDEGVRARAKTAMNGILDVVLEKHGIDPMGLIESNQKQDPRQLLLAA